MTREVDLVSYLPPFLAEFKEIAVTLEAENPEFALVWNAAERVLYNEFIETADEYGISRFEKMLGIYPNASDPLEMRRAVVASRWLNKIPYTIRTLAEKIAGLLGNKYSFMITGDFKKNYTLEVVVYAIDAGLDEELKHLLEIMVPVNIVNHIAYESAFEGTLYVGGAMKEACIINFVQR